MVVTKAMTRPYPMKLIKYLKPYWWLAVISPLLMIGEVMVDLFQPKLMAKIVDEGVLAENMTVVWQTGLLMLFLVLIGGTVGALCAYTASKAAQGFGNDLRCDTFDKVMSLSIQQTDKFTTGSLVTRLSNDITMVSDFVTMALRMFIRSPFMLIGGLYMLISMSGTFGLILAIACPLLLLVFFLFLHQ